MVDLPKRIYWDSCAWIGLINSEADKIQPLKSIWEEAGAGKFEIWTSVYAYLEVINGFAPHGEPYPPEESDRKIEQMLSQSWVKRTQVDIRVAKMARSLKRQFHKDGLNKRPDAIHLASAIVYDADEFHTFDGSDLLHLNGKVTTIGGKTILIRKPGQEDINGTLFAYVAGRDNEGKTQGSA